MKKLSIFLFFLVVSFYTLPSHAWWFKPSTATAKVNTSEDNKVHKEWLKKRFSDQHQKLIPVVAVADIFFSCNNVRKTEAVDYELSHLINEMDRNTLALKLGECLGDDTLQSDIAVNFGLLSCFHAQLAHLPEEERKQKMQLVKQSIAALSQVERKKSFTQCVTEQSIQYLR